MYKQIIRAQDWVFIAYDSDRQTLSLFCLAAWALTEEGHTIGLISVSDSQRFDTSVECARLVTVPPIKGYYKCMAELSDIEHKAFKQGGFLKDVSKEYWKKGVTA